MIDEEKLSSLVNEVDEKLVEWSLETGMSPQIVFSTVLARITLAAVTMGTTPQLLANLSQMIDTIDEATKTQEKALH